MMAHADIGRIPNGVTNAVTNGAHSTPLHSAPLHSQTRLGELCEVPVVFMDACRGACAGCTGDNEDHGYRGGESNP
jgi:hypothetical protein